MYIGYFELMGVSDCGWEHSSFDVSITLEQCYFGQCWAVDVPVWGREW